MNNQEEFGFTDIFGDLEKFVSYEDLQICHARLNHAIMEMKLNSKNIPEEGLLKKGYEKLFEILNKTYNSLKEPEEKYLIDVKIINNIPNKISKKTIEEICSELKKYSNQIEYSWFFDTLYSSDKEEMKQFGKKIDDYLKSFETNIKELEYKENNKTA